jgi:hypothetical protein
LSVPGEIILRSETEMKIAPAYAACFSLVYLTVAYTYLLHPSMLRENLAFQSTKPTSSYKTMRFAFGTLPRKALLLQQSRDTLIRRKNSFRDRSDIGLGI